MLHSIIASSGPQGLPVKARQTPLTGAHTDLASTVQVVLYGTSGFCIVFSRSFERSNICLERQRWNKLNAWSAEQGMVRTKVLLIECNTFQKFFWKVKYELTNF